MLEQCRQIKEKPRMEERRTPEQDKNGGTLFPVIAIKQVKTNGQNKPSSRPPFPLTTTLCNCSFPPKNI